MFAVANLPTVGSANLIVTRLLMVIPSQIVHSRGTILHGTVECFNVGYKGSAYIFCQRHCVAPVP